MSYADGLTLQVGDQVIDKDNNNAQGTVKKIVFGLCLPRIFGGHPLWIKVAVLWDNEVQYEYLYTWFWQGWRLHLSH